jgi:hypothetical protein
MFAPGFFAKTYFAGTYFPPADDGGPSGSFAIWRPIMLPRRRG